MAEIHLEMRNITKRFSGVTALEEVNLSVKNGEIHALVGENGAGKSTLMNILSGVYPHGEYEGQIFLNGEECIFRDIRDSERLGIVIIHQELALIPYLSIAENIFLGNEQASKKIIDWNKTVSEASKHLKIVGLEDNPTLPITEIGVGKQQLVEIAKALAKDVKLLILDEPTAALNDTESKQLLKLLKDLKKKGITSILISHKLNEVESVADAITVIRDGKVIETIDDPNMIDEDNIIKSMVGRPIVDRFPKRDTKPGKIKFAVENWNVYDPQNLDHLFIKDVSFHVREGEVVGLAGLMGAGRTELAMSLFGKSWGKKHHGKIKLDDKEIHLNTVNDAIDHKIAYMTEDRKTYGLVLINDIMRNVSLASLDKVSKNLVINNNQEILNVEKARQAMHIKCSGINQVVESLSGGNQQKVVLSKWVQAEPDVMMLDEPTRGIDVGAKYEIYTIINRLASEGKSIVMISSEMPELLGMCDRIYVVNEGAIVGELSKEEATQESIMKCIMTAQKRKRA
jgi:putative multiple sugar transport system ATP-binding protein